MLLADFYILPKLMGDLRLTFLFFKKIQSNCQHFTIAVFIKSFRRRIIYYLELKLLKEENGGRVMCKLSGEDRTVGERLQCGEREGGEVRGGGRGERSERESIIF